MIVFDRTQGEKMELLSHDWRDSCMIVFDRAQAEMDVEARGKSALGGFSDNTQYFIFTRHHHHPVVSLPTQQNY